MNCLSHLNIPCAFVCYNNLCRGKPVQGICQLNMTYQQYQVTLDTEFNKAGRLVYWTWIDWYPEVSVILLLYIFH